MDTTFSVFVSCKPCAPLKSRPPVAPSRNNTARWHTSGRRLGAVRTPQIKLSKIDTASRLPLEGQPPGHSPPTSAQEFHGKLLPNSPAKRARVCLEGPRFACSGSLDADTSHLRAVLRKRFGARLLRLDGFKCCYFASTLTE